MRSKPMLICSGLAGAVLASSLLLTPAIAQQASPQEPIDLRLDAKNTSRRTNPLDLFNLNSQRKTPATTPPNQYSSPHYTSTNQPQPFPVVSPTAPLATAPLLEINLLEQEASQDNASQDNASQENENQEWTSDDVTSRGAAEVNALDDGSKEDADRGDADSGEATQSDERRRQLNPDQGRPLSVEVVAINVGKVDVGTGVLPEGANRTTATTSYLPTGVERGAMFTCVHWQASLVCHFPLYFEDAMLERHGHVRWGHLQSLASGVKFYSTIPMMPYLRTLRPKHECVYQVGHYRAGSCAPVLKDHIPYDKHAAVVEGLSLAGFFWAMPL